MATSWRDFTEIPWECDFRTHPARAPLEGVLIETRDDRKLLEYTLRNFSCMLPFASLTIFHSPANAESIRAIIGPDTNVRFINLGRDLNRDTWNALVLSLEIWEQVHGERVLIFNTDTGIKRSDFLRYMHFTWIGAAWDKSPNGDPRLFQGNGGFSIRDPKPLVEIIKNSNLSPEEAANANTRPEDVFFCARLVNMGAVLPSWDVANMFSTEGWHSQPPWTVGFHAACVWCPESKTVYSPIEGPTRRLFEVSSATIDGRDCTDLVRIGVGPTGLFIGAGTRLGGQRLVINQLNEYVLENGTVTRDIKLEAVYSP